MNNRTLGPITRRLLRLPAALYRHDLGWLLGDRFLMLTHVGRCSGRRHHTVLEVIGGDIRAGEVIVVAGFGRKADWYRNIRAVPAEEVVVGRRRFRPVQRELEPAEAAAVLGEYEYRNRWVTPVLNRVLSRLVGWAYDGTPRGRARLAEELPFVAFRPQDGAF